MTPTTVRFLYHALYAYSGSAVYSDVLAPWLDEHAADAREMLAPLAVFGEWRRTEYEWADLLEQAYALSRVSDLLLLALQPDLPAGTSEPAAHKLHLPERYLPVTVADYVEFFSALGMHRVEAARFDPFFHEVAAVEQDVDPDAPIEITGERWPCLMLGEMLFGRAGVAVRAGKNHAEAGLADLSTVDSAFLRRHRPTEDESLGWGRNSQWRTDFRRDYLTSGAYRFNVDADKDIDADPELAASPLSRADLRDLVRNRCVIRKYPPVPEEQFPWIRHRLVLPRG